MTVLTFQHRATSLQPPNRRKSSVPFLASDLVSGGSLFCRGQAVAGSSVRSDGATGFSQRSDPVSFDQQGTRQEERFLACIFRHWAHQFSSWRESLEFFCSSQVRRAYADCAERWGPMILGMSLPQKVGGREATAGEWCAGVCGTPLRWVRVDPFGWSVAVAGHATSPWAKRECVTTRTTARTLRERAESNELSEWK